jgi:cytoskeletal protein CcmA (bactofilin family)
MKKREKKMTTRNRTLLIILSTVALSLFALSLAFPVQAFEFKSGDVVIVESDEVIEDDLYVGAATVEINGTIKGDLIAFGSNIILGPDGVVEEDLMAAGQSVIINGEVKDDARLAGAILSLGENAGIGDDLVGAGYSLETKPSSLVEGDLLFMGAQSLLAGDVEGNVQIGAGGVELDGKIAGDVELEVGAPGDATPFSPFQFIPNMPPVPVVAGGLTIGSDTVINGDLMYKAPEESDVPSWAVGGQVEFEEVVPVDITIESEQEPTTGEKVWNWFLVNLRRFISLLIIGVILTLLLPDFVEQVSANLGAKPWHSLSWGVLVYFGFFFLVFVLMMLTIILMVVFMLVTLGAIAWLIFGIGSVTIINLVLAFVISTAFLTKIFVSYLIGRLLLERLNTNWALSMYWSFVAGLIVFIVLTSIPYLGWIINLGVIFFGLGAILLWIKDRFFPPKSTQTAKPAKSKA